MHDKIELICTLTPHQLTEENLRIYAKTGMTILRLNASHISDDDLPALLERVNTAKMHSEYPFKVMLDLPGPEFRVFGFGEPLTLHMGDEVHICTEGYIDPELTNVIHTNCYDFDKMQLTDTRIKFMSGEIEGIPLVFTTHHISVIITRDGVLRPNSHINFTHSEEDFVFMSERDVKLAAIGMQYNVDQIALSMVRTPEDVFRFRSSILEFNTKKKPQIVVKFETLESLYHIPGLLDISDACFVARGDLGLSIPPEAIPLVQRKILKAANEKNQPVYIATQMMTSMLLSETPTRAEINDVATAIMDGAAGITLSEETAIGINSLEAVRIAHKIIQLTTLPDYAEMKYLMPDDDLETSFWTELMDDYFYGPEIKSLINIGSLIWQRGWAEANAGNFSFALPPNCDFMTGLNLSAIGQKLTGITKYDFTQYDWFLVSATGSRYRDISSKGFGNCVLISRLRPTKTNGFTYDNAPVYTFPPDRKPTSEWITHLAVQNWLKRNRNEHRVILHAHPTDWITLSSLPEYDSNPEKLISDLRACLPELDIYFPGGFALAPFAAPGSQELSEVTLRALETASVIIWQKHGVFVTAATFDAAFDSLEIISKAAAVYLQLKKN